MQNFLSQDERNKLKAHKKERDKCTMHLFSHPIFLWLMAISFSSPAFGLTLSLPNMNGACVHVFGDSHARAAFDNIEPCTVHYIGPTTMHRVGREGIIFLNLSNYAIKEGDTAIFVLGEIDVRCHIAKQHAAGRFVDEIIDTLARNYIAAILENQKLCKKIHCVIFAVVPPTNIAYNPDYPYCGSLGERIEYTQKLNKKLHELCRACQFHVIDVYTDFATPAGSLNPDLGDGNVHIADKRPVETKLYTLLNVLYAQ